MCSSDLDEAVDAVLQLFEHQLAHRRVEVIREALGEAQVLADPAQVRQVVLNLILPEDTEQPAAEGAAMFTSGTPFGAASTPGLCDAGAEASGVIPPPPWARAAMTGCAASSSASTSRLRRQRREKRLPDRRVAIGVEMQGRDDLGVRRQRPVLRRAVRAHDRHHLGARSGHRRDGYAAGGAGRGLKRLIARPMKADDR